MPDSYLWSLANIMLFIVTIVESAQFSIQVTKMERYSSDQDELLQSAAIFQWVLLV